MQKGCQRTPRWQPFFLVSHSRNKRPCGPVRVACHRVPPFSKGNAERLNARPHSIQRKQLPKNVGRPTNIYSALLVVLPPLERLIRTRVPLSKLSILKLAHRRRHDYPGPGAILPQFTNSPFQMSHTERLLSARVNDVMNERATAQIFGWSLGGVFLMVLALNALAR